jgi:transposase-like protein
VNKAQKEMTCPRCSEFCVFHKEIEYEVEEQKYEADQCGNFTLDSETA